MENDDDVLEFLCKNAHIIHCLPFTFPGISVRSLISQRHFVSCGTMTYFVQKRSAVPIGHGNSFFFGHGKSWKIIVENEWSP